MADIKQQIKVSGIFGVDESLAGGGVWAPPTS
jgi:hypothetical protein